MGEDDSPNGKMEDNAVGEEKPTKKKIGPEIIVELSRTNNPPLGPWSR
jgi:hypothetical protein